MTCVCSICGQVISAPAPPLVLAGEEQKRAMEYDQLLMGMAHHLDAYHREDTGRMLAGLVDSYGQALIANFYQSSEASFNAARQARRDSAWWMLSSKWELQPKESI